MSKLKEMRELEADMLDCVEELYRSIDTFNFENYKYSLSLIDLLNSEYFELTGQYYIAPRKVIEFHEKKWSIFNA